MTTNPRIAWTLACVALGLVVSLVLGIRGVGHRVRAESPAPAAVPAGPMASAAIDQAALSAGADASWWRAASAELERREYEPSPTEDGFQAPNRAQNLRASFDDGGIEVEPRMTKDTAPAWRFGWRTTGFGRPGKIEEVSPSSPSAAGARVVYERDGWREWYENSAKGLEQGFSIERRPMGEGPLQIAGTFPAALRPELRPDGAVDFLDAGDACVLRYGELHVWDAEGTELPAELVLAGNTLAIQIDDRDAVYPVIVDPLMTSPAWVNESNQAGASYGQSVATAGDVNGDGFSDVIVGAYQYDNGQPDAGQAFVYHGSASGLSTSPAWTGGTDQNGANFGLSVASAGDVNGDGFADVIVGAPIYANGQSFEGGAFVYHGSATGLAATAAWTAEANQANARLGCSVATAGDVNGDGFSDVVVGANRYTDGQTAEGRAFVYHGSAAGLATAPAWTAESNQADAEFGSSVATAGDVNGDGFSDVIVGAPRYTNGQTFEGWTFAYHGSAAGLAAGPAWTNESNQAGASFGRSVATAGDVNGDGYSDVIVGASGYDNGQSNEGWTFAYHGSAAGLAAGPAWTNESNQIDAQYGQSVATAGDVNGDGFSDVIVGAHAYDNGQLQEGRVFAYFGSAAGLPASPAWMVESQQGSALMGVSVATAGDVNGDGFSDVIIGAPLYDNGQTDEGRAFVYHGSAADLADSPAWSMEGNQFLAKIGASVATAGDVNGDGYSDIIVYAANYSNGQANEGRALVFHGSATGAETTPAWFVESDQTSGSPASGILMTAVATAGDVNGDGFSDVIVGYSHYDNDQLNEGRVFAYHGSAAGLATTPAWVVESNQADSQFGYSLATAGDVNGDGFSDVIIGAYEYDNGETDEGRAYVYYGSSSGLSSTPGWIAEGNQVDAVFGISVATAGDVNADGFSDVIVGAPQFENGHFREGAGFVYLGSAGGLSPTTGASWTIESNVFEGHAGYSAETAGDVDRDGFSDVIIGVTGVGGVGQARVYKGSPSGLSVSYESLFGDGQSSFFGQSVGTAGDVNGDGFSDVIVTDDNDGGGRAYFFLGPELAYVFLDWIQLAGCCGRAATAGDVNGDGFSDIILGDHEYSNGEVGEGRSLVYLGNSGDGLDRIARQARTDDSAPIWKLGNSDSDTAFRLNALGRTPAGRGDVRIQFEVKPAGVAFDGTGLVTGPAVDTGTPGASGSAVPLSQLASGLAPETLYHWRLRILGDSPLFPRSPWFSLPYDAPSEADVRTAASTTAVAGDAGSPARNLHLGPSSPNPFTTATQFEYTLPAGGRHKLAVYDVQGRQVAVLANRVQRAGKHVGRWDGRNSRGDQVSSGVYILRLSAGDRVETQKLVVSR